MNLSGRLQHQEELDEGIERWTQTLEKYELTEKCQAIGVRAMPVQSAEDRVERDPQLKARGIYPNWSTRSWDGARSRVSPSSTRKHPPLSTDQRRSSANIPDKFSKSCSASALTTSGRDTLTVPSGPKTCLCTPYIEEALR